MKFIEHCREMLRAAVDYIEMASCDRSGDDESTRFNTVWNDRVLCASELVYAFDSHRACARAFDSRSHLVEQLREVNHLGLARDVIQDAHSVGEAGGHHQVFGSRYSHFI